MSITESTAGAGGGEPVTILYTNWRGETAVRRIKLDFIAYGNEALGFGWGRTEWHPEEQMLLSAWDVDKGAYRTFALAGIKAWGQAAVDAALASAPPAGQGNGAPAGWKLVPVEPTEEMLKAFWAAGLRGSSSEAYIAMLASVPPAPTPEAGSDLAKLNAAATPGRLFAAGSVEFKRGPDDAEWYISDGRGNLSGCEVCKQDAQFWSALVNAYRSGRLVEAPAPTPEAGSDLAKLSDPNVVHVNMLRGAIARPSLEQIIHLYSKEALLAALSPPAEQDPAGQGEPVAWAYEYREPFDEWRPVLSARRPTEAVYRRNIRPLYAAPAPSRPADRYLGETQSPDHIAALGISDEPDFRDLTLINVLVAGFNTIDHPFPKEAAREAVETIAAGPLPLRDTPRNGGDGTQAARDVLAERCRQVEAEGWTPEHDDRHQYGDLGSAAACYITQGRYHYPKPGEPGPMWPWDPQWWKPGPYRQNLVKAGALILAEIERLDRIPCPNAGDGTQDRQGGGR